MTTTPSAVWVGPAQLRPSRLAAEFYRQEYTELEAQLDHSGHKLVVLGKLGRLFTGPFGSKLPASLYDTPNGVPLLRVQNIGELFLNETDLARIPLEVHEDIHRSKLEPGDLALAKAGRLGALSKIPAHIQECNITQHIVGVKVLAGKVRGSYLAAFFLSRFGSFQLKRQGIGTLIKYLGIEETRAAKVVVPERGVQDYIGAKVELAERCRAAAEDHWQKAVGLFQSLFAWSAPPQFSLTSVPAVAELSGRLDPKYYRREYLDAVREITAYEHGWESIGDLVAEVSNGIEYRQFCSDGVPYLTVTNVGDGDLDTDGAPRIPVDAPISGRGRIVESDVLVVRTGSIGQAAVVQRDAASAIISSHFIRLRLHKGDLEKGAWLAFFLNTELGKALQFRIAYGAVQPQIGQDELLRLPVPRLKAEVRRALVRGFLSRSALRAHARRLVNEAKADVEALIEGTLDVQAILAGTVKAPTADDIPELAGDDK
jgi:type I restriction enzyme, S subunit